MKRNIILISLTVIFVISSFLLRTFALSNKPEQIVDNNLSDGHLKLIPVELIKRESTEKK